MTSSRKQLSTSVRAGGTGVAPMSTLENNAEITESGINRKLVDEMVPFLRDPRAEIRQAAAATAVAVSATKEGVALLNECGAVKWLCRISGDVGTIAKDAVSALVNVSAEETMVVALEDMCKAGIVNRMMEAVSAEDCAPRVRDLCLQLLANVTRVQLGAEKVAQVGVAGGAKEGQHVRRLAKWLAAHPAEEGLAYPTLVGGSREDARVVDSRVTRGATSNVNHEGKKGAKEPMGGAARREVLDQWQHCASVLCNAARIPEGRRALRRPVPSIALTTLLSQLSSPNPVRRWGVAGCVRNCCFEELDHPWLLHEAKVVPHLLSRLSDDADEYDFEEKVILDPRVWRKEEEAPPRRREPVECIKRDLLEALLQLCATRESRQSLRKIGVYFVIRELDKAEPDSEISQVCYTLVNFLQRDGQTKQARIDYLKGLESSDGERVKAKGQDKLAGEPTDERSTSERVEILPGPGPPGTLAERTKYLSAKLASESPAAAGKIGNPMGKGANTNEEAVGDQGAKAMVDMLSVFDDDD